MYKRSDMYAKKVEHNNMIYSVDKLRLKTFISYNDFCEIEYFLKVVHSDKIKRFWISDKKSNFRYNYNLEIEEGKSFSIHFMHNSESVSYHKDFKLYNFTIEFNPNKLKDNSLLLYILDSFSNWLLRSFDLAIDIPISILDLIIDKSGKRRFHTISNGGDDVTFYNGSKDTDGYMKIYNKKKESDLPIPGELTRVEVSRKYEDYDIKGIVTYDFGEQYLPNIYLNQYVISLSDIQNKKDKTLLAVLYAIQHGYPINDLSVVYRKKIKELLKGSSKIKFDKKSAGNALRQILFYYFVRPGSKQVFY